MKKVLIFVLVGMLLSACGENNENLAGAGASFPAPYYNLIFKEFTNDIGGNITYGPIGSGGGIRSLKDKTVDFGATDVYLSDEELAEMGADIIHIPTALGAVVLSYSLEGVEDLKLTAEVISAIYRGEVTNWDDDLIKELNPEQNLPNKGITPIFRSDGSGTTFVFSDYMTKADSKWEEELGSGKSLNFAVGIAAKGNPGVAGVIAETEGSIGYIGSEYALALGIKTALVMNSSGNYVVANDESISAAAEIEIPEDTRIMITNSPQVNAYPISTFTWLIVYKEQNYNKRSIEKAKSLISLLEYITDEKSQNVAARIHYAPLSKSALEKTKRNISTITFDGKPIGSAI